MVTVVAANGVDVADMAVKVDVEAAAVAAVAAVGSDVAESKACKDVEDNGDNMDCMDFLVDANGETGFDDEIGEDCAYKLNGFEVADNVYSVHYESISEGAE